MNKITIKIFIIILLFLICLFFMVFKFYPFGSKVYILSNNSIGISIPKFSKVVESEDNYIVLKTFRSKYIIQKELRKILKDYKRYNCNLPDTIYYNEKDNYSILSYNLEREGFYNKIQINYKIGRVDNNFCGKIHDYKKLKYKIFPINDTGYCYIPDAFDIKDNNNINYAISYNCFGNLAIENGMGKMIYFDQILSYGWLEIDDFLKFLEYQSEIGKFNVYKSNSAILYHSNDFDVFYCKSSKNIYIDKEIEMNEIICK
ncbi:MAG: hypothetical protein IJ565_06105 [Bacilli bacterium]|nr:hypothetical protein [Bacilli bacterium]